MEDTQNIKNNDISNRELLIAYFLPYMAYVGIASFFQNRMSIEINYLLRLIIVPAILFWAWRWYTPLIGPKNKVGSFFYGIIFGILGFVVWCFLFAPFVDIKGEPWTHSAFLLRFISASLVVPIFEELFIRGYVFRVALQWDMARRKKVKEPLLEALDNSNINNVKPGAWSIWAIIISDIVFALGHSPSEWLAAMAYGTLISILWILRKDLFSCMIAHGTTNLVLAVYVYKTGKWGLW